MHDSTLSAAPQHATSRKFQQCAVVSIYTPKVPVVIHIPLPVCAVTHIYLLLGLARSGEVVEDWLGFGIGKLTLAYVGLIAFGCRVVDTFDVTQHTVLHVILDLNGVRMAVGVYARIHRTVEATVAVYYHRVALVHRVVTWKARKKKICFIGRYNNCVLVLTNSYIYTVLFPFHLCIYTIASTNAKLLFIVSFIELYKCNSTSSNAQRLRVVYIYIDMYTLITVSARKYDEAQC